VLDIAIATCSERGRRSSNEDNVRVTRDAERWIAVLADGAGGHRGGAEAARRTVEQLDASLRDTEGDFSARTLTRAVVSAHARVQRAQRENESASQMHSTVVALWIDTTRDAVLWSHVGDSRLYRARDGQLDLLTADDSVVQRLVEAGLLTPQQAKVHPQKNQLIAALGIEDELEPHTLSQPAALAEGDAFLLCSDGWWGSLTEQFVTATLAVAATPAQWLSLMQQRIEGLDLPKQDNFSAIGVWVDDPALATRPMQWSG
jgi:serine/threonine protein phosphatase PrpC